MIGLAIGMAAMLVALNIAVSFDARRRSVVGMADAQGNAAFAVTLMSREARMAGQGLGPSSALGCTAHRNAPGNPEASFALRPVVITPGANGASDTLTTLSAGASAVPAAWLIAPYTVGNGSLQVDTTVGMSAGPANASNSRVCPRRSPMLKPRCAATTRIGPAGASISAMMARRGSRSGREISCTSLLRIGQQLMRICP